MIWGIISPRKNVIELIFYGAVKAFTIMEDFLHEHLGGCSGGWDWIELAADYL